MGFVSVGQVFLRAVLLNAVRMSPAVLYTHTQTNTTRTGGHEMSSISKPVVIIFSDFTA